MKYLLIEKTKVDWFVEEFNTAEEALTKAEIGWKKMTENDKKSRTEFYVLESVNPDEDSENHFDGDIIKRYK